MVKKKGPRPDCMRKKEQGGKYYAFFWESYTRSVQSSYTQLQLRKLVCATSDDDVFTMWNNQVYRFNRETGVRTPVLDVSGRIVATHILAPVEWTDFEIHRLRELAADFPPGMPLRFTLIATSIGNGKTEPHVAERIYNLNIDGFNCRRCERQVSHVAVFNGNFQHFGDLRFCSVVCRDDHIAEQGGQDAA